MKQYKIEQFPKNKIITNLSKEQRELRRNQKKYTYDKTKSCNTCMTDLDINEYWVKDSKTGRRANRCRDCELKRQGVVEVGKKRFAVMIGDKGFRRCSVCKDTKPLNKFTKHKNQYLGYSNNCYNCQSSLTIKWKDKQPIKNKPIKHIFNDKEFTSTRSFAKYVLKKYSISIFTVEDRLNRGFTELECTLSRSEFTKRNKAKEVNHG